MFLPKTYETRFESWKSNGTIAQFRVRLLGRDRRLNGSIIFQEDIGNNFYISGETYIDATGSGVYKPGPFSVSRIPYCQFVDNYWKYVAASMVYGKNTDCPFMNHTCPILKGECYVKDVIINSDEWPQVMPRGYFKSFGRIEKGDEVVGTTEIVISFKDRVWR
ncbi:hypothetical protein KR054_005025 [Drosophila jambulina]|nr:hypothetical protein KR054_005025 [Drosophila jambulina]